MATKARPGKKKKTAKPAPKTPLETFLARLPKTESAYYEMLAAKDLAQIKYNGSSLDDLFNKQRERNLAKAAKLKAEGK